MPTRNLTIMFTDIKGFTARVSAGSRGDLGKLLEAHDALLRPVFAHFGGQVIKTIGDAFLVRFDSPTDAVLCGVSIQEVLRQHAAQAPEDERIEVRVAINTGEVELVGDDVLGEPVNIAARLESAAEAGEVWFTEATYLAMNRQEAPTAEVGERTFKGIPYPVRVYQVLQEEDSEFSRQLSEKVRLTDRGPVFAGLEGSTPSRRGPTPRHLAVGLGILVTAAAAFLLLRPSAAERAAADARELIARGDAAAALAVVESALVEDPTDPDLAAVAQDAADAHVDELLERKGAAAAHDWVREVAKSPPLDSLSDRLPELDARATVERVLVTKTDEPWPPLQELLVRHPKDPGLPRLAAGLLEGKVYPFPPLRLHAEAFDRGEPDTDDRALAYCLDLFERHPPGRVDIGHEMLTEHRREKLHAWARDAVQRSVSGHALRNAWRVLRREKDPLLEDPQVLAVHDLLDGYSSEAEADAALAHFLGLESARHRERVLALHAWVLDPPGGWFWNNKQLIVRNHERLRESWTGAAAD